MLANGEVVITALATFLEDLKLVPGVSELTAYNSNALYWPLQELHTHICTYIQTCTHIQKFKKKSLKNPINKNTSS